MNRKHWAFALFAIAAASPAHAKQESTHDQAVAVANAYADCSGLYRFMAEFSTQQGQPATAESMKNLANGAFSAALYYLATEWTVTHKNEPPRSYGSFRPQVEGRAETSLVRFRALGEQGDGETLTAEGATCKELLPGQEAAVQAFRDSQAGNR